MLLKVSKNGEEKLGAIYLLKGKYVKKLGLCTGTSTSTSTTERKRNEKHPRGTRSIQEERAPWTRCGRFFQAFLSILTVEPSSMVRRVYGIGTKFRAASNVPSACPTTRHGTYAVTRVIRDALLGAAAALKSLTSTHRKS
jgi:hypothetical protein